MERYGNKKNSVLPRPTQLPHLQPATHSPIPCQNRPAGTLFPTGPFCPLFSAAKREKLNRQIGHEPCNQPRMYRRCAHRLGDDEFYIIECKLIELKTMCTSTLRFHWVHVETALAYHAAFGVVDVVQRGGFYILLAGVSQCFYLCRNVRVGVI